MQTMQPSQLKFWRLFPMLFVFVLLFSIDSQAKTIPLNSIENLTHVAASKRKWGVEIEHINLTLPENQIYQVWYKNYLKQCSQPNISQASSKPLWTVTWENKKRGEFKKTMPLGKDWELVYQSTVDEEQNPDAEYDRHHLYTLHVHDKGNGKSKLVAQGVGWPDSYLYMDVEKIVDDSHFIYSISMDGGYQGFHFYDVKQKKDTWLGENPWVLDNGCYLNRSATGKGLGSCFEFIDTNKLAAREKGAKRFVGSWCWFRFRGHMPTPTHVTKDQRFVFTDENKYEKLIGKSEPKPWRGVYDVRTGRKVGMFRLPENTSEGYSFEFTSTFISDTLEYYYRYESNGKSKALRDLYVIRYEKT